MARQRKSKKCSKRIFNESMVRYFHTRGINYYEMEDNKFKDGRRTYLYEITPMFVKAIGEYERKY